MFKKKNKAGAGITPSCVCRCLCRRHPYVASSLLGREREESEGEVIAGLGGERGEGQKGTERACVRDCEQMKKEGESQGAGEWRQWQREGEEVIQAHQRELEDRPGVGRP